MHENDGCDFIDIHNAYVTLSDPTTRALYDMKISRGIERRSGGLYSGHSGFYTGVRRWETDQCWASNVFYLERTPVERVLKPYLKLVLLIR
ncbi:DnaJ domain-containing protein [Artemisia annua]|uniref:DnaJ domain-containing protein n=1 Tax=Artemisia annua TaxID=35608 RepID=A0A2U1NAU9_ARTAN|nr:DnaJ domain-containing protein [Artemisia annua]